MAWIELHQAVWTHRKTFELAGLLGLDDTHAASHVVRLWCWAVDNAADGDLSALSASVIAYGAGWRSPNAETFVRALIAVGYLDEDRRIHDWHEYAGRLVERRREDAKRKKESRGHPPDVGRTSNGRPPDVRRPSGVPDRTGPDSTGPYTPPTPPNGGASAAPRRTHTRQKSAEPAMAAAPSSLTSEEMAAWTLPPPAP